MLCHGLVVVLIGLFPPYVIEAPDILRIEVSGLPKKGQPIHGERVVRPDGTVSLGAYGAVLVSGLTPDQARAAVVNHLARQVKKKLAAKLEARVEVTAFNSKSYYVISNGQVCRVSCTGGDTVTAAIGQVKGAAELAAQGKVWVARPVSANRQEQILPVDWKAITREGVTVTNYELLPGDRVFVGGSPAK